MTIHFSSYEAPVTSDLAHDETPSESLGGRLYRVAGKRLVETLMTLIALPVVVPVIAIMACLIALDGKNPFYSQLRVGQGGRTFRMWKLRTMVHNADALLEDYLLENPQARLEWMANQKLKNDPRITWMGRFLRKSSMDELPQIFNVLTGSMSLVGPRPMMVSQKATYTGRAYYRLKPGITGPWQISDRNECEFAGRVHYDELYDHILSPVTDLRILLRTVGVVLRGTGY